MTYVTQFVIHIIFLRDSAGLEQRGSMETTANHKADAFWKATKLKVKENKKKRRLHIKFHSQVTGLWLKDFFKKRGSAPIVLWLT